MPRHSVPNAAWYDVLDADEASEVTDLEAIIAGCKVALTRASERRARIQRRAAARVIYRKENSK